MIVDQSGMENDPLADINQQEAAESPDAGFYGLWDYGPSDFKKSFLNCEAIPFAVCMYTRNRFIPIDSTNVIFNLVFIIFCSLANISYVFRLFIANRNEHL